MRADSLLLRPLSRKTGLWETSTELAESRLFGHNDALAFRA